MFSPKSTIYQIGWLDLVFANRNKSYGAYELRLNSDKRLGRALFISSFLMISLVSFPLIKEKLFRSDEAFQKTDQGPERIVEMSKPPVKVIEQLPAAIPHAEQVHQRVIRHTVPVVVSHPVATEPPTVTELQHAVIGPQTIDGPETSSASNAMPSGPGGGNGEGLSSGTESADAIVPPGLLEKNPEFPGGLEAFAKFLRKNLRYPDQAAEVGVHGKVFVSFVVEKDGRLTDIKILRGIGYGCDDEAARVLKKSPQWKPGIQNQHEVRVLYTIPLVFELGE